MLRRRRLWGPLLITGVVVGLQLRYLVPCVCAGLERQMLHCSTLSKSRVECARGVGDYVCRLCVVWCSGLVTAPLAPRAVADNNCRLRVCLCWPSISCVLVLLDGAVSHSPVWTMLMVSLPCWRDPWGPVRVISHGDTGSLNTLVDTPLFFNCCLSTTPLFGRMVTIWVASMVALWIRAWTLFVCA